MHKSRSILFAAMAIGGICGISLPRGSAQLASRFEAGANYSFVRSNGPADRCGCFSMNGGNGWLGYRFYRAWSAVGEFGAVRAPSIGAAGRDLTLITYLGGARYDWRHHWRYSSHLTPFGQVLLGGVHASGSLAPGTLLLAGTPNSFAMTAGGGADIRLTPRWSIRAIQADYLLTRLNNGSNDRQNNLRISFGVLYRFDRE
jgi:Outer membrane protein beta-barrel domain